MARQVTAVPPVTGSSAEPLAITLPLDGPNKDDATQRRDASLLLHKPNPAAQKSYAHVRDPILITSLREEEGADPSAPFAL